MCPHTKLLRTIFSESHENIVGIAVNTEEETISVHFKKKRDNSEIHRVVDKIINGFKFDPVTAKTSVTSFPLRRFEEEYRFTVGN